MPKHNSEHYDALALECLRKIKTMQCIRTKDCVECQTFDSMNALEKKGIKDPNKYLLIAMQGPQKEINSYCSAIGELSNRYNIEVDFF